MQIGDNLHGVSGPVFWRNGRGAVNLPSAELAQIVVNVTILGLMA